MTDWLGLPLTTLAFCWRLVRRDGITLGFTSHDRDLVIDGLAYRASPGMVPSAIERQASFDVGSVDLKGVLSSASIRAEDLEAGRWDGARLSLFAVNWEAPDADPVRLATGALGAIESDGANFTASLTSAVAALDAIVVEATSPGCRATLGDKRCRVDMAGRSSLVRFASIIGAQATMTSSFPDARFARGTLRWVSGANAGLIAEIVAHDGASLTLAEPPSLAPSAGDMAQLTEGCDRRFETCAQRFGNAANFRGEPHLPGNDLLTRYGG